MEKITLNYTLTQNDIKEYVSHLFGAMNKVAGIKRHLYLSVVFAILWAFVFSSDVINLGNRIGLGPFSFTLYFLFLIPGAFFSWVVLRLQYNRLSKATFEGNKQLAAPTFLEITDDRYRITNMYAGINMNWPIFTKVSETENLFLVLISKSSAYIVPKRAFANATEIDNFREVVYAKVGAEVAKENLPNNLITK